LQQANIQQLGDIMKLSPATRFDYAANFVQPTIRGVGTAVVTAGSGSNVGIYVDGFYSPNPLAADFQLLKLESVQVLKGSQGTLFGRNTTGGAILVTSSKPSAAPGAVFEAPYGSFNTVQLKGYVTTALTDNIAFDIEGGYKSSDGYVRNIVDGPKYPGRLKNWSVRTGLNVDASDNVSFLLRYTHQDVDDPTNVVANTFQQDGRIYAPLQGTLGQLSPAIAPTAPHRVAMPWNSAPAFRLNADIFQLTGSIDLGFANLTSYTQYRADDSVVMTDNDQTAAEFQFNNINIRDRTFTQEFLLASNSKGPLQWTAGLFYFNYLDAFDPVRIGSNRDNIFLEVTTRSRTQSIAGYLDATYEVTNGLFLTAGARYSHDRFDRASLEIAPFGLFTPYAPVSGDRVTPRAVLRYALNDRSSVYASYTKGYKASLTDVVGGGVVEPESMNAFEIGYKYASRAFSLNLASWYYDYKNLQLSIYPEGLALI
jgi:iron complex outermembrane receptor protein